MIGLVYLTKTLIKKKPIEIINNFILPTSIEELKKVVEELKKKQAIINEYENKSENNNLKNRLNKIGTAITGDDGINYSNIYPLCIILFFSLFN